MPKDKPSTELGPGESAQNPPADTEKPKGPPTIHDHAVATGNLAAASPAFTFGSSRQRYSWQHEAAAQLHGWNAHTQHSAEPFIISRETYLAALKAVESDDLKPHLPAVSPAYLAALKAQNASTKHLEASK